jgi:hypothetical protein
MDKHWTRNRLEREFGSLIAVRIDQLRTIFKCRSSDLSYTGNNDEMLQRHALPVETITHKTSTRCDPADVSSKTGTARVQRERMDSLRTQTERGTSCAAQRKLTDQKAEHQMKKLTRRIRRWKSRSDHGRTIPWESGPAERKFCRCQFQIDPSPILRVFTANCAGWKQFLVFVHLLYLASVRPPKENCPIPITSVNEERELDDWVCQIAEVKGMTQDVVAPLVVFFPPPKGTPLSSAFLSPAVREPVSSNRWKSD